MNVMAKRKIIPLSELTCSKEMDTVGYRKGRFGERENKTLLYRCATEWENLRQFREDRDRAKRYTYGDQWSDAILYKGRVITEKNYIQAQGNIPLVNNLIRRLVNNVTGVYTKSQTEPVCTARDRDEQKVGEMMTITLQCNWQVNKMPDVLAVLFEDFLIGGAVFARETFEFRNDTRDAWTDLCNANYMFYNSSMKDPRHWDLNLIGEIHDVTFNELCSKFASSPEEYSRLHELYSTAANLFAMPTVEDRLKKHDTGRLDFYSPQDSSLCRVYEVWTKELKPRYRCHDLLEASLYKVDVEGLEQVKAENVARLREGIEAGIPEEEVPLIQFEFFLDSYWYYQFLTPEGVVLQEGETGFAHGAHPYSLRLYPFVNGEIHSFVNDVIDQQRYINRMITLNDFVIRTGAKGVTLVPEECIPDDMSPEEFAEQWTSVDGVIIYKAKNNVPAPQQFYSRATSIGTAEMIQLQMQLMEDVSGVHNALQGKQTYAGSSAALYSQQTANSTTSLSNLLMRFTGFAEDVAVKKVKLIQQFYDEKRIVNIAGKNYVGVKEYDPEKARDIQFDLSIKESASTPVHRMVANDMLMEFWKAGAITIEMLLENGDFPFADQLLQSIGSYKEQMTQARQGGEVNMNVDPEVMRQVQEGANQNNVTATREMLGRS